MVELQTRRKLTPSQVAKQFGIGCDKVLAWIRSGELRAINAATHPGGRPRYRVDLEDLRDFEQRRTILPAPTVKRLRRRRGGDVTQYF